MAAFCSIPSDPNTTTFGCIKWTLVWVHVCPPLIYCCGFSVQKRSLACFASTVSFLIEGTFYCRSRDTQIAFTGQLLPAQLPSFITGSKLHNKAPYVMFSEWVRTTWAMCARASLLMSLRIPSCNSSLWYSSLFWNLTLGFIFLLQECNHSHSIRSRPFLCPCSSWWCCRHSIMM